MWKNIEAQNKWLIKKAFLLHGRSFKNPTCLIESDLRAYWEHWFKLSESGKPFAFKRVDAPTAKKSGDEAGPAAKDSTVEEDEPKGKTKLLSRCRAQPVPSVFPKVSQGCFRWDDFCSWFACV